MLPFEIRQLAGGVQPNRSTDGRNSLSGRRRKPGVELVNAIIDHTTIFHYRQRPHSKLDYRTPTELGNAPTPSTPDDSSQNLETSP